MNVQTSTVAFRQRLMEGNGQNFILKLKRSPQYLGNGDRKDAALERCGCEKDAAMERCDPESCGQQKDAEKRKMRLHELRTNVRFQSSIAAALSANSGFPDSYLDFLVYPPYGPKSHTSRQRGRLLYPWPKQILLPVMTRSFGLK